MREGDGGGGEEDGPEEAPVNGAVLVARGGLCEREPPGGGNEVIDSEGESPNDEAHSSASCSSESENEDETSSTDIEDDFLLGKDTAQEVSRKGQYLLLRYY